MVIEHRALGKSGLSLPILGLGGTGLTGVAATEAADLVAAALRAGVDYFDTAPFYGMGESEARLGAALGGVGTPVIVSTKVGRLLDEPAQAGAAHTCHFDYSYSATMRSLETSLTRLARPRVDIVLVHDLSPRWHGDRLRDRFEEAIKGAFPALRRLRDEGTIGAFGIGVNDCAVCLKALDQTPLDLVMLAGRATLIDTAGFRELLPRCQKEGVGVIAAAPFNSGILATGAREGAHYFYEPASAGVLQRVRRIEVICDQHGVVLAAAALQIALRHPAVTCVLPGPRSATELGRNLQLLEAKIPDAFWRALRSAGLIGDEVPD